jgi:hypothetical protein
MEDIAVTARPVSPAPGEPQALGFGFDLAVPPGWQDRSVLRFLAPEAPRDLRLVHRGADGGFAANVVITRVPVESSWSATAALRALLQVPAEVVVDEGTWRGRPAARASATTTGPRDQTLAQDVIVVVAGDHALVVTATTGAASALPLSVSFGWTRAS